MGKTIVIDDSLYEEIEVFVKNDPINYPTIKNFADKAIDEKIKQIKKEENKE